MREATAEDKATTPEDKFHLPGLPTHNMVVEAWLVECEGNHPGVPDQLSQLHIVQSGTFCPILFPVAHALKASFACVAGAAVSVHLSGSTFLCGFGHNVATSLGSASPVLSRNFLSIAWYLKN